MPRIIDARTFYTESTVRRTEALVGPDDVIRVDGMYGNRPEAGKRLGRVLVVDDRAEPYLRAIDDLSEYGFFVFADAPRCVDWLAANRASQESATAMVCRDISAIGVPPLPDGLTVQPIHRLESDPPGVSLDDAVIACANADPMVTSPDALADFLRTKAPPSSRLFAAIDQNGVVRATSGSFVVTSFAGVIFVSTDRNWRGKGVATAMTAWAIATAKRDGALSVCLDATDDGLPIYRRLGFEEAGRIHVSVPF